MKHFLFMIYVFGFLPLNSFSQILGAPGNLLAEIDQEERFIKLSWNPVDSTVAGYNLFVKTGRQDEFYLWAKAGLIYQTRYDYKILSQAGAHYEFKVCAVQNFPKVIRSEFSNVVAVDVPSQYLPMVNLNNPRVKKNTATISWIYNTTANDLEGFILYLDEEELKVKKEERNYVANSLSAGKHIVQIVAYSKSGLRSEMSTKKFILVK